MKLVVLSCVRTFSHSSFLALMNQNIFMKGNAQSSCLEFPRYTCCFIKRSDHKVLLHQISRMRFCWIFFGTRFRCIWDKVLFFWRSESLWSLHTLQKIFAINNSPSGIPTPVQWKHGQWNNLGKVGRWQLQGARDNFSSLKTIPLPQISVDSSCQLWINTKKQFCIVEDSEACWAD